MTNLKPYFNSLEDEIASDLQKTRRKRALLRFVEKVMPNDLKDRVQYSIDNIGSTCVRCWLYPSISKDPSADQYEYRKETTIKMIAFLSNLSEEKPEWDFEKKFRENEGHFWYASGRNNNKKDHRITYTGTTYHIFFENASNVDGCKIKKKKVTREEYVSDCEDIKK